MFPCTEGSPPLRTIEAFTHPPGDVSITFRCAMVKPLAVSAASSPSSSEPASDAGDAGVASSTVALQFNQASAAAARA